MTMVKNNPEPAEPAPGAIPSDFIRDIVAAHVDVARERLLDDPQQLVAGAEQAHHRVRAGYDDRRLRLRRRRAVGHSTIDLSRGARSYPVRRERGHARGRRSVPPVDRC